MTDGEQMERLWSFLRRMAFITKEMTPSHRIDLLTDALLHYSRKQLDKIGNTQICTDPFVTKTGSINFVLMYCM